VAIITLAGIITVFGLPTFLTREIAAGLSLSPTDRVEFAPLPLVMNALVTSVVLFTAVAILLIVVQEQWPSLFPGSIDMAPLAVILGRSILEINSGALAGLGKIWKSTTTLLFLLNAPFLLILLAAPYLSSGPLTVGRVFEFQMIGVWFGAGVSGIWTWKEIAKYPKTRPPLATWAGALRDCVPLVLVNGLAALQQNVVFIVLGSLLSTSDVGIYRIAERIGGVSQFLRAVQLNILQPRISREWRAGKLSDFAPQLRRLSVSNAMFNMAFFAIFAVDGNAILRGAFGIQAASALPLVLVLFAGYAGGSAFGFSGMVLSMTSYTDGLLRILAFTLAILCIFLVLLTVAFGRLGAAESVAFYTILTSFLLWREVAVRTGIDVSLFGNRKG
jgi:O-antigen/teichoic acid export membrane protein